MNSSLEIDGKVLHPIKEAARSTTYSRDYITRLAREGKVVASYIGRQWFVDLASLKSYAENAALEQEVRKKILSQERKRERQLREAVEERRTLQIKKAHSLNARAAFAAAFVLGVGLLAGQGAYQLKHSNAHVSLADKVTVQQSAQLTQVSPVVSEAKRPATQAQKDTAQFTQASLGEIDHGIILFPAGLNTERPERLFSDTVEVRSLSDGSQVIVPVDASGNQVGNEVPFVRVPVSSSNM
ncbi:hypothetical protein KC902_02945 [Candidatus Kaiserbacteria bacterium]|nr:hypothetical protein [Candidatus Kaiserbacteria bacterium]USN88952.1 MAG: hypothetical protein H6780_00815 [Candidatus Nomurabacteria bacterium]